MKKPSLYWCETVRSKSKGLKTVSAQTDQFLHTLLAGSTGAGFTKSNWVQTFKTLSPRSERGGSTEIIKKDLSLLQTTETTAAPELSHRGRNGLEGGGVDICVSEGEEVYLLNSLIDGVKIWVGGVRPH